MVIIIGGTLLGIVIVLLGLPLWGHSVWIISLHGMKGLHCWSKLIIPTETPGIYIESVLPLKLHKKKCSSSGHLFEAKIFFNWS